ncbi:hypothetical protein N5C40_20735 [Pseudomonas fulva]|uniref:hypothetical protein n=1 Tax=Pseudomonas fulva TaxID=47880 RepID=UPI001F44A6FB|nr:hypothetical protein [Pseudomonas fulva]MDH1308940.1 hypothetical protein [Pseudomonas fulva]
MNRVLVLLGLLAIAGCDQTLRNAHDAVKEKLFDPDSAEFRNDRIMSDGTVCGEVNAKNRMGGYVGFTDYSVQPYTTTVRMGARALNDCDERLIAIRTEERKEREEQRKLSSQSAQSLHSPHRE